MLIAVFIDLNLTLFHLAVKLVCPSARKDPCRQDLTTAAPIVIVSYAFRDQFQRRREYKWNGRKN